MSSQMSALNGKMDNKQIPLHGIVLLNQHILLIHKQCLIIEYTLDLLEALSTPGYYPRITVSILLARGEYCVGEWRPESHYLGVIHVYPNLPI